MKLNSNTCSKILISFSAMALIFHILILVKIIPYEITWGGRLKNDNEMYVFELLSIIINLFFIYILFEKGNFIKPLIGNKSVSIILWIFFAIFTLNTIGNLFAKSAFEKYFTILTLLNAVLIWQINKPLKK